MKTLKKKSLASSLLVNHFFLSIFFLLDHCGINFLLKTHLFLIQGCPFLMGILLSPALSLCT